MKTIKRLLFLAVVTVVAAGAWFLQSPLYALYQVREGVREHNVERVEKVVAFERFATSTGAAAGEVVADAFGLGGDDLGSTLLRNVIGIASKGAVQESAKQIANGMRGAIKDGRVEPRIGALALNDGFSVLGDMQSTKEGAYVKLHGTCDKKPASIVLELERKDGPIMGLPRSYIITGIEPRSAKLLAKECGVSDLSPTTK